MYSEATPTFAFVSVRISSVTGSRSRLRVP